MAERRCSAHADVEQRNGGTLSARKPRDPLSSYGVFGTHWATRIFVPPSRQNRSIRHPTGKYHWASGRIFCTPMVYSVPTGQVVPTSGQVVDSTCECSGVSTTDFYQLTGSVQLKLLNDSCRTKLPLPRNPPLLEM